MIGRDSSLRFYVLEVHVGVDLVLLVAGVWVPVVVDDQRSVLVFQVVHERSARTSVLGVSRVTGSAAVHLKVELTECNVLLHVHRNTASSSTATSPDVGAVCVSCSSAAQSLDRTVASKHVGVNPD